MAPLVGVASLVLAACSSSADRAASRDTMAMTTAAGSRNRCGRHSCRRDFGHHRHHYGNAVPKCRSDPGASGQVVECGPRSTPGVSPPRHPPPRQPPATRLPRPPTNDRRHRPLPGGYRRLGSGIQCGVGPGQFLKWDAGSKTATFELHAGPFNFNGYTSGGGTLTLPPRRT